MRDIGDRHTDFPAAAIQRCGKNGIVEIAGIGTVDGDERKFAHVAAPFRRRDFQALGLGDGVLVKHMRNVILGNGQRAESTRRVGRPEIVDDARRFAEMAASWQQFSFDKVTLGEGDITASLKCNGVARATRRLLQDQAAAPANRGPEQALLHGV